MKPSRKLASILVAAFVCSFTARIGEASGVVSVSIGADWAATGIVGWEDGVSEATVVLEGLPDSAAVTRDHFLVGRFSGQSWLPRAILGLTRTADGDRDTFRLLFEPVVAESAFLVVAAGPTTGLPEPHLFAFGHLEGDTDGDGLVTPGDALLVSNHLNSGADYDPQLDLDRSGEITPSDLAIAVQVTNDPDAPREITPTDPPPSRPGGPPLVRLTIHPGDDGVILALSNLSFAFEYRIEAGTALGSWSPRPPVVASTAFGEAVVERREPVARGGRGFFRVRRLVPTGKTR